MPPALAACGLLDGVAPLPSAARHLGLLVLAGWICSSGAHVFICSMPTGFSWLLWKTRKTEVQL